MESALVVVVRSRPTWKPELWPPQIKVEITPPGRAETFALEAETETEIRPDAPD